MALQTSGPISFLDITNELGGEFPTSMGEYGQVVGKQSATSTISMYDFYGVSLDVVTDYISRYQLTNDLTDSSGGPDGTVYGGLQPPPAYLNFDGVDDYFTPGNTIDTDNFGTVSYWVWMYAGGTGIAAMGNGDCNSRFHQQALCYEEGDAWYPKLYTQWRNGSTSGDYNYQLLTGKDSGDLPEGGKWIHVCYTRNEGYVEDVAYFNATPAEYESAGSSGGAAKTFSGSISVGFVTTNVDQKDFKQGISKDYRFYNRVLDISEVQAIYDLGV